MTKFSVRQRLAEHYRVGRVFLAGDACHVHAPLGGQGMNTGIQDSIQLAWKLAFVLQSIPIDPEFVLNSYEEERRPVGQNLVRRTGKGLEFTASGWFEIALQAMTLIQDYIPDTVRISILRGFSMLDITYQHKSLPIQDNPSLIDFLNSPLKTTADIMGLGLVAGDRMPHGHLVPITSEGHGSSLTVYSVLTRNFGKMNVFLNLESNYRAAAELISYFCTTLSVDIYRIAVVLKSKEFEKSAGISENFPKTDVYYDADGLYWKHVTGWEVVLVRPDCYLQYVGRLSDFDKIKQHIHDRVRKIT